MCQSWIKIVHPSTSYLQRRFSLKMNWKLQILGYRYTIPFVSKTLSLTSLTILTLEKDVVLTQEVLRPLRAHLRSDKSVLEFDLSPALSTETSLRE